MTKNTVIPSVARNLFRYEILHFVQNDKKKAREFSNLLLRTINCFKT